MTFVTKNENVFKLSGAHISCSPNLEIAEHRTADDNPIFLDVALASAGGSRGKLEIKWAPISKARRDRGDLVDFSIDLRRREVAQDGDILVLRFPISPELICDPDFAVTGAASFHAAEPQMLLGAELGFGSELGFEFGVPFTVQPTSHLATAWKYDGIRRAPHLELRLHLRASDGPLTLRLGRLFAGYDYDPYIYNPEFEYLAHLKGRPSFEGGAEVLAEFERQARAACRTHRYHGMQAFIKPFLVMREGRRRFPMLVGTPNSISWYAIDPHHHIDFYETEERVQPGDVSLDCGAHAGQMSTFFGIVAGKGGKVIAFDPFPQNYLQVEAQARLNGLDIESARAGVGDSHKTLSLSILGQMTTEADHTVNMTDRIDMKIVPLDDYLDARPTFIKLDIEGAEVGALHGAKTLLETYRPRILVELHTQFLHIFGHTPKDFFDAIPRSLYRVHYRIEGVDHSYNEYQEGDHQRVTRPALVIAEPR